MTTTTSVLVTTYQPTRTDSGHEAEGAEDAEGRGGGVDDPRWVVQAPGHPDEDRDGGFEHGGWHLRYFDDMSRGWVVQGYAQAGGFLLGRRTYENEVVPGFVELEVAVPA